MGAAARRAWRIVSWTTTSAPASAVSGSPTAPRATSAALSGHWACKRAAVASPRSARRDWRQRLIVHRDHGQRVGEVRSRVSDRDPDRLTDVARDVAGENGHAVGAPSLGAGGDERADELG